MSDSKEDAMSQYAQQVNAGSRGGHVGALVSGINYPWYSSWTMPTAHQITRFRGAVKDLDHLPTDALHGDGYYVEKAKALVLREQGGWYHFDRTD